MENRYDVVEISVHEVARKRQAGKPFVILDVREPQELELANLGYDVVDVAPLSELSARGERALPPPARDRNAEIVVVCHHGIRSAQVAAWLAQHEYVNVKSMAGGLDAYANEVDESIGRY